MCIILLERCFMNKYFIFFSLLLSSCSQLDHTDTSRVPVDKSLEKKVAVVESVKIKVANATTGRGHLHKVTPKFSQVGNTKKVRKYCDKIDKRFYKYGWGKSQCKSFYWHHVRNSIKGDPLMWVTFGDEKAHALNPGSATFVMCGVHGDEITPVKFCFDILHHLHTEAAQPDWKERMKNNLIVVIPIANPDSLFKKYPTRTNSRGVDINRNLPTNDWKSKAVSVWKKRYRSDKRRFPGKRSLSEPETLFQVNLIKRYKPTKIISVHAPLTILDYDGPTVASKHYHDVAKAANNLLVQMSKKAKDYRIKNYPFFPGSLGNYAGNERNIPTYTLELPTSDNRKHRQYWKMFKESIDYALFHRAHLKDEVVLNEQTPEEQKVLQNN